VTETDVVPLLPAWVVSPG
jgi:hypothetical protein